MMSLAREPKKQMWITSTGGPLVLMEKDAARTWLGVLGSSDPGEDRSDYERACSVDDYVGLIFSNGTPVIVLDQEPLFTTWYPKSLSEGIIVRCVWSNDLQDAETAFSRFDSLGDWEHSDIVVDLPSELVLFDSSSSGYELDETVDIKLEPGKYAVQTLFFDADSETRLLLHKLRKA